LYLVETNKPQQKRKKPRRWGNMLGLGFAKKEKGGGGAVEKQDGGEKRGESCGGTQKKFKKKFGKKIRGVAKLWRIGQKKNG